MVGIEPDNFGRPPFQLGCNHPASTGCGGGGGSGRRVGGECDDNGGGIDSANLEAAGDEYRRGR